MGSNTPIIWAGSRLEIHPEKGQTQIESNSAFFYGNTDDRSAAPIMSMKFWDLI